MRMLGFLLLLLQLAERGFGRSWNQMSAEQRAQVEELLRRNGFSGSAQQREQQQQQRQQQQQPTPTPTPTQEPVESTAPTVSPTVSPTASPSASPSAEGPCGYNTVADYFTETCGSRRYGDLTGRMQTAYKELVVRNAEMRKLENATMSLASEVFQNVSRMASGWLAEYRANGTRLAGESTGFVEAERRRFETETRATLENVTAAARGVNETWQNGKRGFLATVDATKLNLRNFVETTATQVNASFEAATQAVQTWLWGTALRMAREDLLFENRTDVAELERVGNFSRLWQERFRLLVDAENRTQILGISGVARRANASINGLLATQLKPSSRMETQNRSLTARSASLVSELQTQASAEQTEVQTAANTFLDRTFPRLRSESSSLVDEYSVAKQQHDAVTAAEWRRLNEILEKASSTMAEQLRGVIAEAREATTAVALEAGNDTTLLNIGLEQRTQEANATWRRTVAETVEATRSVFEDINAFMDENVVKRRAQLSQRFGVVMGSLATTAAEVKASGETAEREIRGISDKFNETVTTQNQEMQRGALEAAEEALEAANASLARVAQRLSPTMDESGIFNLTEFYRQKVLSSMQSNGLQYIRRTRENLTNFITNASVFVFHENGQAFQAVFGAVKATESQVGQLQSAIDQELDTLAKNIASLSARHAPALIDLTNSLNNFVASEEEAISARVQNINDTVRGFNAALAATMNSLVANTQNGISDNKDQLMAQAREAISSAGWQRGNATEAQTRQTRTQLRNLFENTLRPGVRNLDTQSEAKRVAVQRMLDGKLSEIRNTLETKKTQLTQQMNAVVTTDMAFDKTNSFTVMQTVANEAQLNATRLGSAAMSTISALLTQIDAESASFVDNLTAIVGANRANYSEKSTSLVALNSTVQERYANAIDKLTQFANAALFAAQSARLEAINTDLMNKRTDNTHTFLSGYGNLTNASSARADALLNTMVDPFIANFTRYLTDFQLRADASYPSVSGSLLETTDRPGRENERAVAAQQLAEIFNQKRKVLHGKLRGKLGHIKHAVENFELIKHDVGIYPHQLPRQRQEISSVHDETQEPSTMQDVSAELKSIKAEISRESAVLEESFVKQKTLLRRFERKIADLDARLERQRSS